MVVRPSVVRSLFYSLVGLVLVSSPALPQGISGITVQTIGVTPPTFRPGDSLSLAIDIKAPASSGSGAVHAYVNVFRGDATTGKLTWLATDYLGGVRQDAPALVAGQVLPIAFQTPYTVPSAPGGGAYPVIYFVAGAYDPPAEFAQEKIAAHDFSCPGVKTTVCRYVRRRPPVDKVIGSRPRPPH